MGLFSNILAGGKRRDSSAAANEYLNKIPGMTRENINPYIKPGMEAKSFVDEILGSYTPSEGYQFQKGELEKALGNTAAAGGYAGGEFDQMQRGKLIQGLLSQDMQQYLGNVLDVHNNSFAASQYLNDVLGGTLNAQGGLAFRNAETKNERNAALRNALLGAAGTAAGGFLGGPAGAAIGGKLFGGMGGGGSTGGYVPSAASNYTRSLDLGNVLSGGNRLNMPSSTVPGAGWGM
jgi:hypothetical protein